MNKITKKRFGYFTALALFLVITVFIGFYGVFRYYTYQYQEKELKKRAETIKNQLETFMDTDGPKRGQGAYLKFLDHISMADTYIIGNGNGMFFCRNDAASAKKASQKITAFAGRIFASGTYTQMKERDEQGNRAIYLGFPIRKNGKITAALVIYDTLDIDQHSFFLAVTILGGCLFFALAMSGIFSVFLAKRFMMPIQQIAAATRELAHGNYQVKTEVYDKNEIGVLARKTDILAEKLESARRESDALKQMQKDYIANISHELRTPVTVIRSSLEAICDGIVKTAE